MPQEPDIARRATRKVMLRILPFTFLIFVISFLDRANLSFAALEMSREIGLTSEAFGFAAGVFFIGYMFFEVPSNAALRKVGARVWLARIQLTWGAVACATAFLQSANQLYLARFMLGVAEAGLVPGLIAYYNYWFRMNQLAKTGAILGAAVPLAYIIAGPLSTWIMTHVTIFGLSGWRAMILVEGAPALVTGVITYFHLTDRPEQARWLTPPEKAWLVGVLDQETRPAAPLADLGLWQVLKDRRVLMLGLIYLLYQVGNFGIGFWMPQLIKGVGVSLTTMEVGLLSAIPYIFATIGLYLWSVSSDRTGERRLHAAAALLLAGLGLAASATTHQLTASLAFLSAAMIGFYAFKTPFNVIPRLYLTRDSAVIAFAVINTIGQVGAFGGPFVFGLIKSRTDGPLVGLLLLSGCTLVAALMVWRLRFNRYPPVPASDVSSSTGTDPIPSIARRAP